MTETEEGWEEELGKLIEGLPAMVEKLSAVREEILSTAVMLAEIPSPTFGEKERIRFALDRFRENGLEDAEVDEHGNATALIAGAKRENAILLMAHADTVFDLETRHVVQVGPNTISGPGIADNSIGLATVISLPRILETLDLQLKDDLLLLTNVESLGRGNLNGSQSFLETVRLPVRAGICVEGASQGRLSHWGLGTMRGEIRIRIPSNYDWSRFGASGAIGHLSRIVNRIMQIPIPKEPKTKMALGSMRSGSTYNAVPLRGLLRFEITSEEDEVVNSLKTRVEEVVEEFSLETEVEAILEVIAQRPNSGIPFAHPMVKTTRRIMDALGISPKVDPTTGDLNSLIQAGHPGVTLGLTTAENLGDETETIHLPPLFAGIAQLIALLQAIDNGLCVEQ